MIGHFCGLINKLKRIVVQIRAGVCWGGVLRDETETAARKIISVHEEKKKRYRYIILTTAMLYGF